MATPNLIRYTLTLLIEKIGCVKVNSSYISHSKVSQIR